MFGSEKREGKSEKMEEALGYFTQKIEGLKITNGTQNVESFQFLKRQIEKNHTLELERKKTLFLAIDGKVADCFRFDLKRKDNDPDMLLVEVMSAQFQNYVFDDRVDISDIRGLFDDKVLDVVQRILTQPGLHTAETLREHAPYLRREIQEFPFSSSEKREEVLVFFDAEVERLLNS
jgi:hypothetical protein